MKRQSASEVNLLLQLLEEAFQRKSWHGTNLRGSLRHVTAAEAAQRTSLERHNIWELVVHCAYWKYTVRRRLLEEKRGSFPLKGSNFFPRPKEFTEAAWRQDVHLLEEMHRELIGAVRQLSDAQLHQSVPHSKLTRRFLLTGIASHDLYHAGQIQLLKRLIHL
jgi:hypothetical protein